MFVDLDADHRVLNCLGSISHVATQLDRAGTAREACTETLELIERSDLDRIKSEAREFRIRDARLNETPAGTFRLYSQALGHALESEGGTAARLSRETWERRDTHDEDSPAFAVTLAAGIGLPAHLRLAAEVDENDLG